MKVMVVGAGQMGLGIAQVLADAGHKVLVNNLNHTSPEVGIKKIKERLTRAVAKGKKTSEDVKVIMGNLKASRSLKDAAKCDMIFEALAENAELKGSVFAQLDRICEENCIFATNTSSVSITKLAAYTTRPDRFIGMHFMNPVPVMKLVEIIPGLATAPDVLKTVYSLTEELHKIPVEVRDVPGFVSNRVLQAMINEAICCLYEGVGTADAIDNVMKYGMNHPMGPLETADLIGLDTVLFIQQTMYEGYGLEKYHPNPLLVQYVNAGWLGKKTGRGFYYYENGKKIK